jgi:hypothetical protein
MDMGSHRLPRRAIARNQVLMVAQLLPHRETTDSGEVRLHRHLHHGQGNPSTTIDAAIDGIVDMVARILEEHLLEHLLGPGHGGDAKEATGV